MEFGNLFDNFSKINEATNDPKGLQAIINPITVSEIPMLRAKGGKKGLIMALDKNQVFMHSWYKSELFSLIILCNRH